MTEPDLVADLPPHRDAIAASTVDGPRPAARGPRPAIVWDIVVHHADLHEALGLPALAPQLWELCIFGPREDDRPVP